MIRLSITVFCAKNGLSLARERGGRAGFHARGGVGYEGGRIPPLVQSPIGENSKIRPSRML